MRKICKAGILSCIFLFALSTAAMAQSSNDLELAKAMAKSYGYSESEINEMLNKEQNRMTSGVQMNNNAIDRNSSFNRNNQNSQNLQNMKMAGYGGTQGGVMNGMIMLEDSTYVLDSAMLARNFIAQLDTIYGHRIFRSPDLNFIPNYNIPTPASYKLAPGDEIVLDIWGATFSSYTYTVSPEGSVTIPDVGPVYLVGLTVEQAEKRMREKLSVIYSGISGDAPNTFLRLTLGRIRSLSVNVVGDVENPGTFTLPSLSTVFTAAYMAGGPTDIGTLRNIRIYRNGKVYRSLDFYKLLIDGKYDDNIRLEDDDLIMFSPYECLVKIEGSVRRPMYYEMKEGENIADAIRFAAGYKSDADETFVHVIRKKGDRARSFDVKASEFGSFTLMDGDILIVPSNISRNANTVHLSGAVWHPGDYAITDSVSTLEQLLGYAGGVMDEAYMDRGLITRFNEQRDTVSLFFNLAKVLAGEQDIPLVSEDSVTIFASYEFNVAHTITTQGELNNPSELPYRRGLTVGDAILLSGGFTLGASRTNVDVARRNIYDKGAVKSDSISLVYTLNLEDDPDALDFPLEPYDIISVRLTPSYRPQTTVNITGEVNFPGHYVVEKSTVRLSDILSRAGGYTDDAYLEGAVLSRQLTEEEYQRALSARILAAAEAGIDTTMIEMPRRNERYTIAIDVQKALENPDSYYDVVLSINDSISIPKYNSTVRISGAVLFPTVVTFDPSISTSQYIKMAGGYAKGAIRNQKYIVFMNGSAATKGSRNFRPRPGCEIIVPERDLESRQRISAAEIVSIASSTTSIATMVVSMVNLLR